ncbi:hypothetical protein COCOR_05989 [Corallococcus coralloides DSM 2259]|uniref:Uncharacterized protein n=1 Tax=Corallococcus coralloides (strain ATCC 25202 / DSM 2259 / NBRC 100086 / M2) TaxID=1144275 RepID=H8MJQ5_CORCM|nr:hypothetical protein COCOR_05989 [Corallococcus coralloides DSM 2259]
MARQVVTRKVRRGGGTLPRSAAKRVRGRPSEEALLEESPAAKASARGPGAAAPAVDIRNLPACIREVVLAAQDTDPGPPEPTDYHQLRGRLEAARATLPPLYRDAVLVPYLKTLDRIGPQGFADTLVRDPRRESEAGLLMDAAHAILQNGEGYQRIATDAFEEVVSDLYDGFLSAEDRRGVHPPDQGTLAPLVKWGNPDFGPYTWPVDATFSVLGLECGIVNLPPSQGRAGLLAWAALGHEVGGHDILHADTGLAEELSSVVYDRLQKQGLSLLANYWARRIDETGADVLGILNMGPAAGIGLIGYFRGLDSAFGGAGRLRNVGGSSDPHPADIVRGYLAGSVVKRLRFSQAEAWAQVIFDEVDKDLNPAELRLGTQRVTPEQARLSADVVADAIMTHRAKALEGQSLAWIQNWRNQDEQRVQQLRRRLATGVGNLTEELSTGIYAAHVVAAGVVAGLSEQADVRKIFDRMVRMLKQMHDRNPAWGPLFVRHRGDVVPHFIYPFPTRRT